MMNKQPTDITQFKTLEGKINYAIGYLKERIYALVEETQIDLGRLIETLYIACDDLEAVTWEKYELVEAKDGESLHKVERAISEELENRGVNMDRIYKEPPDKEPKKITDSHVYLVLSFLKDKAKELGKKTKISPLFYLEKMHSAFDDIEDVAVCKIRLEDMAKNGTTWKTWKQLEAEMIEEGLLEKQD